MNNLTSALLWQAVGEAGQQLVQCSLCSHFCRIEEGKCGLCGVRKNEKGTLYTMVANKVAALNLDPVEKKPLFHFYPGSYTLSLGTAGCNFTCQFCQNHNLAQDVKSIMPNTAPMVTGKEFTPAALVNAALQSGAHSLSYTYSEPTVFFELTLKTAALAREQGLHNILVSNGYQSPLAMKHLKNFIQAANFDLKAFSNDFYRDSCGASLQVVLDNLKRAAEYGWWLEITTLLIPTLNDNPDELFRLATFIRDELGPNVPWHVSRYRPAYKMNIAPTPVKTLEMAVAIGKEAGLNYVYTGNLPSHEAENTYCPACQTLLVQRRGFEVEIHSSGTCPACDLKIPGEGWT